MLSYLTSSQEIAIQIGLIALIILPSLLIGAYAFHISKSSNERGTHQDADFWNLLQGNIISICGSLALAISFFRHDRKNLSLQSAACAMAVVIWFVGVILGALSVAIYTVVNTGWSSSLSTLSNVLGSLAPLMLILAAPVRVDDGARAPIARPAKQKVQ